MSSAQNELKRGGTGKRRLGRGSTTTQEVQKNELGRKLGRSCSCFHSLGSAQSRASEGEAKLSEERRGEEVAGRPPRCDRVARFGVAVSSGKTPISTGSVLGRGGCESSYSKSSSPDERVAEKVRNNDKSRGGGGLSGEMKERER